MVRDGEKDGEVDAVTETEGVCVADRVGNEEAEAVSVRVGAREIVGLSVTVVVSVAVCVLVHAV